MSAVPRPPNGRLKKYGAIIHSDLEKLGLSAQEYRVYAHLLSYVNNGSVCYPSIDTIANACRLSRRKVQKCLRSLEVRGLIRCQSQYRNARGPKSNQYHLLGIDQRTRCAPPAHVVRPPCAYGAPKHNPCKQEPWNIPNAGLKKGRQTSQANEIAGDRTDQYTSETRALAAELVSLYYEHFSFGKTSKARQACLDAFLGEVERSDGFHPRAKAFFDSIAVLSAQERQAGGRQGTLPVSTTCPWELVKHIQRQDAKRLPTLAANCDSLKSRTQRFAQQPDKSPDSSAEAQGCQVTSPSLASVTSN
jgi:hypothetical protein